MSAPDYWNGAFHPKPIFDSPVGMEKLQQQGAWLQEMTNLDDNKLLSEQHQQCHKQWTMWYQPLKEDLSAASYFEVS